MSEIVVLWTCKTHKKLRMLSPVEMDADVNAGHALEPFREIQFES
jgi:hypothetical protein